MELPVIFLGSFNLSGYQSEIFQEQRKKKNLLKIEAKLPGTVL